MDVSSFMTGYFIGLVFGALAFVWWTYQVGSFLPKEWPFKMPKITFRSREKQSITFESRRTRNTTTPAE